MYNSIKIKKAKEFFYLKILTACWFGCLVYTLLSLSIGSHGVIVFEKLTQERDRLNANFNSIRTINGQLYIRNYLFGSHENDLKNPAPADPDTILAEARNMGYGLPGEVTIHFNGIKTGPKTYIDPGTPAYASRAKGVPHYIIMIISLLSGVSLLLCLILPDILGFCRHLQEESKNRQWKARIS
jgi:hypothetical protein